jgi:hypothetical protein
MMLRVLTMEELLTEAAVRFGADWAAWVFQCPRCGDQARVDDFPAGSRHRAGQDCLGRFRPGRGCDWSCRVIPGPWSVVTRGGHIIRTFGFGEAIPAETVILKGDLVH